MGEKVDYYSSLSSSGSKGIIGCHRLKEYKRLSGEHVRERIVPTNTKVMVETMRQRQRRQKEVLGLSRTHPPQATIKQFQVDFDTQVGSSP